MVFAFQFLLCVVISLLFSYMPVFIYIPHPLCTLHLREHLWGPSAPTENYQVIPVHHMVNWFTNFSDDIFLYLFSTGQVCLLIFRKKKSRWGNWLPGKVLLGNPFVWKQNNSICMVKMAATTAGKMSRQCQSVGFYDPTEEYFLLLFYCHLCLDYILSNWFHN